MAARADRRKNASAAARSDRRSGGPGGQTRLFGHEPAPVGASVDPLGLLPGRVLPTVLVVGDETVSGDATVGIVGTNGAIPTVGNTLIVGTAAAELTPRLTISTLPWRPTLPRWRASRLRRPFRRRRSSRWIRTFPMAKSPRSSMPCCCLALQLCPLSWPASD